VELTFALCVMSPQRAELTRFCLTIRNVDFVNMTFHYIKNCVTLQMNSSLTKFYTISNTTCFLHLWLLYSPTTSGEDCIVSYVLDTSRVLTLLFACYIKMFIDDIKHAVYILLKNKLIILFYIFKATPFYPV